MRLQNQPPDQLKASGQVQEAVVFPLERWIAQWIYRGFSAQRIYQNLVIDHGFAAAKG
jgi:hypothetical protein